MIRYRLMSESDIPAGLRLCRAAGWNQVEDDWRIFLETNPGGNRVAERDGAVVGTVATLPFSGRFSWISMVLVDPAERGHGIGTDLLQFGLDAIGPGVCARLDATPAGQPIYERLGFAGEFEISRMTAFVETPREGDARRMRDTDFATVVERDIEACGVDRGFLLNRLLRRAPQYARMADAGHSFGREGFLYDQIGPVVAAAVETAQALVGASMAQSRGRKVVIDAPRLHPAWLAWLEAQGFKEERRLLRMSRGVNAYPGRPGNLFAIAGPELG
jgi:GNAT superfamily N-acetyltransferase